MQITVFHLGYLKIYLNIYCISRPGFNSWQGQEIFLFSTVSRPALGPTQPPIQWVTGALSPGVEWQGVKLITHLHLLPRSRMVELYFLSPHTSPWHSAKLIKHKDNFVFTFYLFLVINSLHFESTWTKSQVNLEET
jgi:hypothetical protein